MAFGRDHSSPAGHGGDEKTYTFETADRANALQSNDQESPSYNSLSEDYNVIQGDSAGDIKDMLRLGKKQEFKRNFNILSTLGFISIYMATWEFVLVSLAAGLINGGFGGLFWTFVGTVTCYSSIVASLAEMESMAPVSTPLSSDIDIWWPPWL